MPIVFIVIIAIAGIFVLLPGCTVERIEATDSKNRKWLIECNESQYAGNTADGNLIAGANCEAKYIKGSPHAD